MVRREEYESEFDDSYYFDDPTSDTPRLRKSKLAGIATSLMALVAGGIFISNTFAGNIAVNIAGTQQFGQGVGQLTSCSKNNVISLTPISGFNNASNGGAHYLQAIKVSNIPDTCFGYDFTIMAYDSSTATPLTLFASSTKATVYENGSGVFSAGAGSTGMSVSSGAQTFTAIFATPISLSSNSVKFTLQTGPHIDLSPVSGSYIFDNSGTQYLKSASTGYAATDFKRADFTIECWVYPLSLQYNWTPIIAIGSQPGGKEIRIGSSMSGNGLAGALYPGGGRDSSIGTVQMTINTWHHLALVRSGNTMAFYLDGVQTGYDSNALFNSTDFANDGYIYIGLNPWPGDGAFNGRISNVRFVKGLAVYTGAFTPPSQSLSLTQSAGLNIAAITNQTSFLMSMTPGSALSESAGSGVVMSAVNGPTTSSLNPFN
jgi:hypothetical protein